MQLGGDRLSGVLYLQKSFDGCQLVEYELPLLDPHRCFSRLHIKDDQIVQILVYVQQAEQIRRKGAEAEPYGHI